MSLAYNRNSSPNLGITIFCIVFEIGYNPFLIVVWRDLDVQLIWTMSRSTLFHMLMWR